MKPIEFPEQSTVIAKDQPQYIPFPAFIDDGPQGAVVFCVGLTWKERITLLITGKLWCSLLCFHKPVTPWFFSVKKADVLEEAKFALVNKVPTDG
jgi:hypothetical protein